METIKISIDNNQIENKDNLEGYNKAKPGSLKILTIQTNLYQDRAGRNRKKEHVILRILSFHCYQEQYGSFSENLKIELLYDLVIPILGIYPKELNAGS